MKKISLNFLNPPKKSSPDYSEKMAKLWLTIASILIAFNIFFVLTLLQMSPKLKMLANVMTPDSMHSMQLIQAEPFSADISDKNLIEQMLVRFYLTERHTLFNDEREIMIFRWGRFGRIAQLSTPQVYREFYAGLGELPEKFRELNHTQSIDIRSMSLHNNVWTVEFDIHKLGPSFSSVTTHIAVLHIQHIPSRRFFRTTFSNPYGFVVTKYTESVKK